ncbi:TPA: tail fiber assembly protein [Serratia fonticola]
MNYGYSAKTNIFYMLEDKPVYEANGNWPDDVKPISDELWNKYCVQGPEGKMRGADSNGLPCWVDIPPPSKEQMIEEVTRKKSLLLAHATKMIAPLQGAQDLGIALKEEQEQLLAWQLYLVLINRIKPSDAPDIDWPKSPE